MDGTRVVYLRCIRQFIAHLNAEHPSVTDVTQVTKRHIEGWMRHLVGLGRKNATRRVRLLAVRFWFDYLATEPDSGVANNPALKIPLPVPDEKLVPVIPDEDLVALLRTCSGRSFIHRRDTAIIRTLLDTGLRREELVSRNVSDLDMTHHELTVLGKGGKPRIVPLSPKTVAALRSYLRARERRPAAASPALFLSIMPTGRGNWRLTGGGVGEMIARRSKLAGLGHIWPHMLRHTWAHDMLDNGANEGDVERLGGWSPGSKMIKRYGSSMADARARNAAKRMARGDRV